MVKFTTKFTLDIKLERKQIRETSKIFSQILRETKETIRTRLRKLT